jgi:hypothetical protein
MPADETSVFYSVEYATSGGSPMRLICYADGNSCIRIVPAEMRRQWMDDTERRSAYRCLPLAIANTHGWMILNTASFVAEWTGEASAEAVVIKPLEAGSTMIADSIFGSGVLTFGIDGLFRTEPGYDLMVTGPTNLPKDGIQPLTGLVETDWSPFPFSMSWKFTRPHLPVSFVQDEPICMIFPVARGVIETAEPEFRDFGTEPELLTSIRDWAESRAEFIEQLGVPGSSAQVKGWQKDYFDGGGRFGTAPPDHRTRLRAKPFTRS